MGAHHRLKLRRFAGDQFAQLVVRKRLPMIVKGFTETTAIIKGEVVAVVCLFRKRDAFFSQHALQGGKMQRLAIGNHTVAIKDDGFEHK